MECLPDEVVWGAKEEERLAAERQLEEAKEKEEMAKTKVTSSPPRMHSMYAPKSATALRAV